jgi:hypothetical protein
MTGIPAGQAADVAKTIKYAYPLAHERNGRGLPPGRQPMDEESSRPGCSSAWLIAAAVCALFWLAALILWLGITGRLAWPF